jgi:N-acetylneuraminic acid mutarotase
MLSRAAAGPHPRARRDHSLTFDGERGVLYLFGGRGQGRDSDELWTFDPATSAWAEVAMDGPKPPARFGHNACYDPVARRVVITMGQAGPAFFNDVWAFEPATGSWRELGPPPDARPRPRYGAGAAYDPAGHRLFVTHGFTDSGRFDDTWVFDLAAETWSPIATEGPVPVKRCLTRAEWHPATAQLLLFGGQSDQASFLGDLWALDPVRGAWSERRAEPAPGPRNFYSASLDGSTGRWYLFGGDTSAGPASDVWAYDAVAETWSRLDAPAAEAPAARFSADVAPAGGGFYLFGGTNRRAELDDLWALRLTPGG